MKTLVLAAALFLAASLPVRAGDENDLMKRMGFSEKEIAATAQAHQAIAKELGPKPDQTVAAAAAAAIATQAQGISEMRTIRQCRYEAQEKDKAAQKEAQDAAARAQEAIQKARAARDFVTMAATNGLDAFNFSRNIVIRDRLEDAAATAREEADQKAREAADVEEQNQKIIAKANAEEALLKSRGIDE
jgi:hypothetical protein